MIRMDGGNPRLAFQYGKELLGYHVWITPTEFAASPTCPKRAPVAAAMASPSSKCPV